MPREDPFDDRQARFDVTHPRYPPETYSVQYADNYQGGVTIEGQHVPWTADEDDESKPLTLSPHIKTPVSAGADFIRRQTMPRRAATTRQVKLTQGHWINEYVLRGYSLCRYPVPTPISSTVEPKWTQGKRSREFT